MANVRNRSLTVAIKVCLSFNLVVISNFNIFPFPPSKLKLIGDVPMNKQNAAARRIFFPLFCTAQCLLTHTESSCVIRRCAANREKNPRNKIGKLKTLQIWTPLPIGATGIVASIYWRSVGQCSLIRGVGIPILNSSADFLNPLCCVLHILQDIAY